MATGMKSGMKITHGLVKDKGRDDPYRCVFSWILPQIFDIMDVMIIH
jgi:hypothetical protein